MTDCIFCKIINKEVPAEIVYEDDLVIAFPDVHPIAPVHILFVPRRHIESINELTEDKNGEMIAGRLIIAAKKVAKQLGIDSKGYKLLFRTGSHGGQEVPHIHLHLVGGARLTENIHPI